MTPCAHPDPWWPFVTPAVSRVAAKRVGTFVTVGCSDLLACLVWGKINELPDHAYAELPTITELSRVVFFKYINCIYIDKILVHIVCQIRQCSLGKR